MEENWTEMKDYRCDVESIVILYYMITGYPLKKITGITFWAKSLVPHDKVDSG